MLASCVLAAWPMASNYLTEGNDPGRTGWMKDEKVFSLANVKDMKLLWKVKLETQPLGGDDHRTPLHTTSLLCIDDQAAPLTPIVVNGVVFAASAPANAPAVLYALNGVTGATLWQSGETLESPLSGNSLWVGSGHVFVGTRDGTVYAFGFAMERH